MTTHEPRYTPFMQKTPINIRLQTRSRLLNIEFDDVAFTLPCEYLRVCSPSAEVQGHGPDQAVLQVGKETVNIVAIEPVGNYAVRLIYDDAHNSGLYSWDYLYELGHSRQKKWSDYLEKLSQTGHKRCPQAHDHYLE